VINGFSLTGLGKRIIRTHGRYCIYTAILEEYKRKYDLLIERFRLKADLKLQPIINMNF